MIPTETSRSERTPRTAADILEAWLRPDEGYEDLVDLAADFLQTLIDEGRITRAELDRWRRDRRKAARAAERAEAAAYEAAVAAHFANHPEGPRRYIVALHSVDRTGTVRQGHTAVSAEHFAAIVAAGDPRVPAPVGTPDGRGLGWDEARVDDWFARTGLAESGRVRFDETHDGAEIVSRTMTLLAPAAAAIDA